MLFLIEEAAENPIALNYEQCCNGFKMISKKTLGVALSLIYLYASNGIAQLDSSAKLTFSAMADFYYSYDFANPENHEKSNFIYNHNKHNEINANLILLKANYEEEKVRANFAAMFGTYPQYNLSAEPIWARFINEANVGIKLAKTKNVWLDVGVMPSHIGFESAVSPSCWNLTRSILAENTPYFETGAKVTYTVPNKKFYMSAMILNGWQRVTRADNMHRPSGGTQFFYEPSKKWKFNYSTFLGSDKPDSLKSFRHFHNTYVYYEPSEQWGFIFGFDIGYQKTLNQKYHQWYSPIVVLRKKLGDKIYIAARAEYYMDKHGVRIVSGTPSGFQTTSASINFDYKLNSKVLARIEGKVYESKDAYFNNFRDKQNYSVTTSLSISL